MLELRNINYTVQTPQGPSKIIDDLNLLIAPGSLTVLTGPNGGGKTTLAKIIMGLVTPTDGKIFWNSRDITDLDITDRAKAGIS